jgi:hypothetical protein
LTHRSEAERRKIAALEQEIVELQHAQRDASHAAQITGGKLSTSASYPSWLPLLMDGSILTIGPLFAAAVATHNTLQTFLVGLAASVGAGIWMGFAEALSDGGSLTGRGALLMRGAVCGAMTAIGGLGHTLPYLIPDFWTATVIAVFVVAVELGVISYIRHRFMDTPFLAAAFQVVVGGMLVFLAGILIGSS